MVALTYGDTRVSGVETKTATKTASKVETAPRRSWFARFMDALMESRMRQAEREIRLHAPYYVPPADVPTGNDTPRGGW